MSKILNDELNNLFKLMCTENQAKWVFQSHIQMVVGRRAAENPHDVLKYALELQDSMNIEEFFKQSIKPSIKFRDNDIFKVRDAAEEKQLLELVSETA